MEVAVRQIGRGGGRSVRGCGQGVAGGRIWVGDGGLWSVVPCWGGRGSRG